MIKKLGVRVDLLASYTIIHLVAPVGSVMENMVYFVTLLASVAPDCVRIAGKTAPSTRATMDSVKTKLTQHSRLDGCASKAPQTAFASKESARLFQTRQLLLCLYGLSL